jgi:hypothetical protein
LRAIRELPCQTGRIALGIKRFYSTNAKILCADAMQLDSNRFIDLMAKFESAKAVPDVWRLLLGYAKTFGFGFGVVTELPRGPEQLYDIALSAAAPPGWRERYSQQSYHRRDPIVLHAAFLRRPYTWAEAAAHARYSKAQKRIVEERRDFSITGGFTTPVVWRNATAIASVSGDNPNLAPEERLILHAASVFALSRIFALANPDDTLDVAPLSKRERECLEWASAGKNDREIGEIPVT